MDKIQLKMHCTYHIHSDSMGKHTGIYMGTYWHIPGENVNVKDVLWVEHFTGIWLKYDSETGSVIT